MTGSPSRADSTGIGATISSPSDGKQSLERDVGHAYGAGLGSSITMAAEPRQMEERRMI